MPTSQPIEVCIAETGDPAISPKLRKSFNAMVRRVVNQRALQQRWIAAAPLLLARGRRELDVLRNRYATAARELVFLLDRQAGHKLLGKGDSARLADIIFDIASEILDQGDEELSALRRKYDSDPREDDEEDERLDSVPLFHPMAVQAASFPWETPPVQPGAASRLLAGQNGRSKAVEAARFDCMQQIYVELLPQLQPDMLHSLEERELRRGLLDRCCNAPARGDLLSLLQAQFALGLSDPARLEQVGQDRIKRYCVVLEEQLYHVLANIKQIEERLMMETVCWIEGALTPEIMERELGEVIVELGVDVETVERQLAEFENIKALKQYLKNYGNPTVFEWP